MNCRFVNIWSLRTRGMFAPKIEGVVTACVLDVRAHARGATVKVALEVVGVLKGCVDGASR